MTTPTPEATSFFNTYFTAPASSAYGSVSQAVSNAASAVKQAVVDPIDSYVVQPSLSALSTAYGATTTALSDYVVSPLATAADYAVVQPSKAAYDLTSATVSQVYNATLLQQLDLTATAVAGFGGVALAVKGAMLYKSPEVKDKSEAKVLIGAGATGMAYAAIRSSVFAYSQFASVQAPAA